MYDVIGIGIGPFNLGLAALTKNIQELECLFVDKNPSFRWHPGLLLPTAKMQVPFYADLVTLADPTSPYAYMNYLKATGKLFRFAISEAYYPYRTEYNDYCRWVVEQLNHLYFGYECKAISYEPRERHYRLMLLEKTAAKITVLRAKHLVIGIGSRPQLPEAAITLVHPNVFHSAEYLHRRHVALMHQNITLIGSGQSAAEIFLDLLPHLNNLESLKWYTRSDRFYVMDESKFALEMSSPEYIRYFYHLPKNKKANILAGQHDLYKGINKSLIEEIYQRLYLLSLDAANKLPIIRTNCELKNITKTAANTFTTAFEQRETGEQFAEETEVVILATGYEPARPAFIDGIAAEINCDEDGNYRINEDYSVDNRHTIFVQNAEWHTHGFNSADLGLGPYRNAKIINAISKREIFAIDNAQTFQQFKTG
jgi:lysine N6-hydroxylase